MRREANALYALVVVLIGALIIGSVPVPIHNGQVSSSGPGAMQKGAVSGVRAVPTHTVFVEDFTATWCQYCPAAGAALDSIYQSGNYDFYFVSMITDMVDEANARAQDLNVQGVPDVMFDGGYKEVVGAPSSTSVYTDAINISASRQVPDIEMVQHVMRTTNSSEIYVQVDVKNNEATQYTGHIRSYVTEIVSRYKDHDGHDYRFGFIGFAIDTDIIVPAGGQKTFTAYWDGSRHSDTNDNTFGDISMDNIFVISSVFNSQPHLKNHNGSVWPYTAYYVDECVATGVEDTTVDNVPPVVSIESPKENDVVSGTVEIIASAQDDGGIGEVRYIVDSGQWHDMALYEGKYHAFWDTRNVSDGTHTIKVRAKDKANNTADASVTVQVLNAPVVVDTQPPEVNIIAPANGAVVSGSVELQVEATDNVGVAEVQYKVDNGGWMVINKGSSGLYTDTIDTTALSDGQHSINVKATDDAGNEGTDSVTIVVNNTSPQAKDTTPPTVVITSPTSGTEVSDSTLIIQATVTDESGLNTVSYAIDTILSGPLTSTGGDTYTATVSLLSLSGGLHTLVVTAEDKYGNQGTGEVSFLYTPNGGNAGGGGGGNVSVEVLAASHEPKTVHSGESVTIHVTLSAYDSVKSVYILVYEDGVQKSDYEMEGLGGGEYEVSIGSFAAGTKVQYKVYIILFDGSEITRDGGEFEVLKSSPQEPQQSSTPGFTWVETMVVAMAAVLVVFVVRKKGM